MSIHAPPPSDEAPSPASPRRALAAQDAKVSPEGDAAPREHVTHSRPKPVSTPLSRCTRRAAGDFASAEDALPKKLARPAKDQDGGEIQLHSNAGTAHANDAAVPMVIPAPIPAGAPAN